MLSYVILIIVFCFLSEFQYKKKHILRFLALILLIIFIGLRNEIGTDYFSYKDFFEESSFIDLGDARMEVGWHFLNTSVSKYTNNFKIVTLFHAAIVVLCLHLALKKFKYYTLAFVLFVIVESGYIFIVNGMRQGIAMAIFF